MQAEGRTGMRIKDRAEFASKPKPLTFSPDVMVKEAVEAMCEKRYGSVIITDPDDRVIGVMTERDIMTKIVNEGRDARSTPLSEIMTRDPRVASEDDDIVDWLRMMSNERFRRLPVVDKEKRIKAVFTQGDFVSFTWPDLTRQALQLGRATLSRNFPVALIGGGVAVYSLLMIIAIAIVVS